MFYFCFTFDNDLLFTHYNLDPVGVITPSLPAQVGYFKQDFYICTYPPKPQYNK